MSAPRRAVVLGGAGFLGRRLVAALLREPGAPERPAQWPAFDEVHVFDRAPLGRAPGGLTDELRDGRLSVQLGDLRSRGDRPLVSPAEGQRRTLEWLAGEAL